jgi:hypothetical protein
MSSIRDASATRTLMSQPSPNGSELTSSGESTTASLTASTSPVTGANSSPTDLVDSISPTTEPSAASLPAAGRST